MLPLQGSMGSSPGQGTKIPHTMQTKKKLKLVSQHFCCFLFFRSNLAHAQGKGTSWRCEYLVCGKEFG